MSDTLRIAELFKSIQGESTRVGCVCAFIRLAGCNLSCSYCDTSYARRGGKVVTFAALIEEVEALACDLVEITGGEPLLQQGTGDFVKILLDRGKTVLVETNGSFDIGILPDKCIRVVDVKCPSSGMSHSFLEPNIGQLHPHDEVKCVIGDRDDFEWALSFIRRYQLSDKVVVLFSPVTGKVQPVQLASWILEENAPVRLQLQLHTIIWGQDIRGV
jgi:7-carboxy-7-deazaguanine synthase